MKYVIAIEPGSESAAWGVIVPNLPGCFSAGDTLDEAVANAEEAIVLHVQTTLEDGDALPEPRTLAHWQADSEYAGCIWAVVDAPIEKYLGPAEKINITVPRLILAQIDEFVKAHGLSRSGFLVDAARDAMRR